MLYKDFERAFEARLQTRAAAYVNAVEYHRVQFGQIIEHLLRSILEQTDNLIKQSDADWAHTEEVVSDILYCADVDVERGYVRLERKSLDERFLLYDVIL